jgi:amidase
VNPATGPVSVRGAEPGDSLVIEILDIKPGPQGVATIIPGYGQLIDVVESPIPRYCP